MAIYVIITEQCKNDLQEHQMELTVNSFRDRILRDQNMNLFDNFPPPFLKKRFSRPQRLVAASLPVDGTDDVVVIFLRFLIRGGNEYTSFIADPKSYKKRWVEDIYTQEYLKEWLDQNRTVILPILKDPPSPEEMEFLWGINQNESNLSTEEFVFETPDWISATKDEKMKRSLILLPEYIMKLTEKDDSGYGIEQLPQNLCIVYRNFKHYRRLFLAGIFLNKDIQGIDDILGKYKLILEKDNVRENDISKASKRSYPSLLLADTDLWFGTQTDNEANLSLSPEETDLLRSAYAYSQNSEDVAGFPMFINGRAGSGKSTILQYLFADYLGYFFLRNSNTFKPPIFITYSGDLVEKSKKSVSNILKFNYKFIIKERTDYSSENMDVIVNESITPFRRLLLSIIAKSEFADKFQLSLYIDFKRFKAEYKKKFKASVAPFINPENSWHVIRTYIKGYVIDDYMDEEEYIELPRDEKTVTRETFETIYKTVFEGWYKGICNHNDPSRNHWDDQDLIRFVLENDLIKPEYPAIFCDEAQDFTRIELEFLFRMSIYSNRRIDSQMLNRVPFVFAGDPFQTLNPTGFKWDNIKTSFAQKFIHSLDPKLRFGQSQIHYKELSFNYRSSRDIVLLSNSIQALRALYFGHSNVTPQTTWQVETDAAVPVYFSSDDPHVWDKISENKDIRIIVPCGEGEETDYVMSDPYLSKYIEMDEKNIPRNVISPLRSKGLEYERVIVYGFGSNPNAANFFSRISRLNNSRLEDREQLLPYEYFINQLYVAISRAKSVLIVVDSRSAIEGFWEFVRDPDFVENRYAEEGVDFTIWEDSTGALKEGTDNIWTGHIENKKELADKMFKEGMEKMSSFILRQSAFIYHERNEYLKENKCRAYAYLYEGEYENSGEYFEKCSMPWEAIDAYWKGKCFNKLVALSSSFPETAVDLKVRVANQYQSPQLGASSILFKDLHLLIKDVKKGIDWIGDPTLKEAINRILEKLSKSSSNEQQEDYARMAAVLLLMLEDKQISPSIEFAEMLIKAAKLEEALGILKGIGVSSGPQYEQLLRFSVQKKLASFENIGQLANDEKRVAAKILLDDDKFIEAAGLLHSISDTKNLTEIALLTSRKERRLFIDILKILISTYINRKEFRTAISFVDGSANHEIRKLPFFNYISTLSVQLTIYITKELATSPLLHLSDQVELIRVSDFLRTSFIENRVKDWSELIHPLVVGAAMERAGKDIDCLKFYGMLETSQTAILDIRVKAKERLAATKLRRSRREERDGRTEQSDRSYNEAIIKSEEAGVDLSDLAEFPVITMYLSYPLESVSQPTGKLSEDITEIRDLSSITAIEKILPAMREFHIYDILIRESQEEKIIRLFSTKSFLGIDIHYTESRIVDNHGLSKLDMDDLAIDEWGIRLLRWRNAHTEGKIEIRFIDMGIDLGLRLS
jgi:hypothetical protein